MGRPDRNVLVGAGVAAAVLVAVVVVTTRDGGGGGGDCLSSLADHLPADVVFVRGSDHQRAQEAGVDLGAPSRN